jgi:hypothetical protein
VVLRVWFEGARVLGAEKIFLFVMGLEEHPNHSNDMFLERGL